MTAESSGVTTQSTQEPSINHELTKVFQRGQDAVTQPHLKADLSPSAESGARYIGESWYATFILSTSDRTTGHVELHRSRQRDQQPPAPATIRSRPRLPEPHYIERLLEAYFRRFHVFCPILDWLPFLSSVRDGTISVTLLQCVLFVASIHCDASILHSMGYSKRIDAQDELFNRARTSFDADDFSDRTTMVLSSYLLHYWFGKPTSFRDALFWIATSIRSAQCMGLHRSTAGSDMTPRDRSHWKRLWWCLYVSCTVHSKHTS